MEFLDPELKRARAIRLFTGYFLVAILISLATIIIVYLVQGYSYNPYRGTINQSGLLFVGSQPVAASVTIDGQSMGTTNTKLSLGSGKHQITLKAAKYRSWSNSFNLIGGSVLYLTYPLLIPVNITVGVTYSFDKPPAWVSQSPNRRWLVVQTVADSPVFTIFDLQNPTQAPTVVAIPSQQLISLNGQFGSLTAIGWADDNVHLLLQQRLADGQTTYIVFDRDSPDQSVNLASKISMTDNPVVTLRNNKYDSYYVFDAAAGQLFTADLSSGQASTPLLSGVVAYKTYASNLIVYVTYAGSAANQAAVMVLSNQTDKYLLQSLPRDPNNQYLLNMTQYNGTWYYVCAADSGNKVYIYRNPLSRGNPGNSRPITPQMSLSLTDPEFATFSTNARFIGLQSGKRFVVYDAEQNSIYRFTSPLNIVPEQPATWLDGQRFSVVTDSQARIFDFDGTNQQTLTASLANQSAYFDNSYHYVYTLVPQVNGKISFEYGQLVAK